MAQFILEVGTEEMPSDFLIGLQQNLREQFREVLQKHRVVFNELQVFTTPRRFVVWIAEMESRQSEHQETHIGPPENIAYDQQGELTKAGQGFINNQGVSPEDVFIQETAKGKYLAVNKIFGGTETVSLLPDICIQVLNSLPFPKKMRWEETSFLFGRPIRWILAMLDDKLIPFDLASLSSDCYTYGHRVMGPGPWKVDRAEEYFSIIEGKGKVTLNSNKRREYIRKSGDELATELKGRVFWDEHLLEEVANLVEYPRPVIGSFDQSYLELPKEVLLTSMQKHQKSFGLEDEQGNLLPYFLCTLNLEPTDLQLVKTGWERVLKARLEDAYFFWQVDNRTNLEEWSESLQKVVFLGPLGSMAEKSRRISELGLFLGDRLLPGQKDELQRAAFLAKNDLVSEMVGEFSDLQGIMGGIYARKMGESETVAQAIYEHYLPTGQDSPVPQSRCGALLSIADKIDNLIGCFGLGMIPSGTQDPYALRRQTLAIVRVILEHELRLSLLELMRTSLSCYGQIEWKLGNEEIINNLKDFFAQRIRVLFGGKGYDTIIVDAAIGAGFDDIYSLEKRLRALDEFRQETDFENSVLTFKRVDNIIRKQGQQEQESISGNYDSQMLQEKQEIQLARTLEKIRPRWDELWQKEDFGTLFGLLKELRPDVDAFFDNVMVMCQEDGLRLNRLNLLQSIVDRLSLLADFSQLQV